MLCRHQCDLLNMVGRNDRMAVMDSEKTDLMLTIEPDVIGSAGPRRHSVGPSTAVAGLLAAATTFDALHLLARPSWLLESSSSPTAFELLHESGPTRSDL